MSDNLRNKKFYMMNMHFYKISLDAILAIVSKYEIIGIFKCFEDELDFMFELLKIHVNDSVLRKRNLLSILVEL